MEYNNRKNSCGAFLARRSRLLPLNIEVGDLGLDWGPRRTPGWGTGVGGGGWGEAGGGCGCGQGLAPTGGSRSGWGVTAGSGQGLREGRNQPGSEPRWSGWVGGRTDQH